MHPVTIAVAADENDEEVTDASAAVTDVVEIDEEVTDASAAVTDVAEIDEEVTDASAAVIDVVEIDEEVTEDMTETTAVDRARAVISGRTTATTVTDEVHGKTTDVEANTAFDQRAPGARSARPMGRQLATHTTVDRKRSADHAVTTIEGGPHGRGPVPRCLGSPQRG